jgi:hypothetical protein
MRRRWLVGAGLILLTAAGAMAAAMFRPEPLPFPLRTVSAGELAAIGVSVEAIPPTPPWELARDRLAALLPAVRPRPQVQKSPAVAPPHAWLTIIDETVQAVVTAPRWGIARGRWWVLSGRDPAVPAARFVVIADPAGNNHLPLRLVLPRSPRPGELPAAACDRAAGMPAPPAGGISAADATALVTRYQQPGMSFVLCAVPQQLREMANAGEGWATDHWVWKVVIASGSNGCVARGGRAPQGQAAAPKSGPHGMPACVAPTTSWVAYDYFSGAGIMGGSPAMRSHA